MRISSSCVRWHECRFEKNRAKRRNRMYRFERQWRNLVVVDACVHCCYAGKRTSLIESADPLSGARARALSLALGMRVSLVHIPTFSLSVTTCYSTRCARATLKSKIQSQNNPRASTAHTRTSSCAFNNRSASFAAAAAASSFLARCSRPAAFTARSCAGLLLSKSFRVSNQSAIVTFNTLIVSFNSKMQHHAITC